MDYQELHQRYGSHIAKRVQAELDSAEFNSVKLKELVPYLEFPAEAAEKEYQLRLYDPFKKNEDETEGEDKIDLLHHRWRDAEEIAYLVSVAEEVGLNVFKRRLVG